METNEPHAHFEAVTRPIYRDGEDLVIESTNGDPKLVLTPPLPARLAEFILGEIDERTGRTRSSKYSNIVAYEGGPSHTIVVDEMTGISSVVHISAARDSSSTDPEIEAARERFRLAVPGWWLAQPGEVWLITMTDGKKFRTVVAGHPRRPVFIKPDARTLDCDSDTIAEGILILGLDNTHTE